jgi:hypothetical protein
MSLICKPAHENVENTIYRMKAIAQVHADVTKMVVKRENKADPTEDLKSTEDRGSLND